MNNENIKKDLLKQIFGKYKDLLKILETEGDDSISFAKWQLNNDIKNLEELLIENSSKIDYDEILRIIKVNYYRMYPVRGGLTDFFVWRENFDERMIANKLLNTIKDELKDIFDNVT